MNLKTTTIVNIFTFLFFMISVLLEQIQASALQLDKTNFDKILNSKELVLVNFYADWCKYSRSLAPIFDEVASTITTEFPEQAILGKIDSEAENSLAKRFHVSKYPTMKLFRNGKPAKREYRGPRTAQGISQFIRDQLQSPYNKMMEKEDVNSIEKRKRNMMGYFADEESLEFKNFLKVCTELRDDCAWNIGVGDEFSAERTGGNTVVYKPPNAKHNEMIYMGSLKNLDLFKTWAQDKCVPLVREITFENAEELTEEGLPFLILFHHPDDTKTVETFQQEVGKQLIQEKSKINFLVADGVQFSHPLHHLGKSTKDLPLIAIDSFRHMYLYPNMDELTAQGKLKQFVLDMHSGKLHREFHHGPDKTTTTKQQDKSKGAEVAEEDAKKQPEVTELPESQFQKLAPSKTRYSFRKDEL